MKQRVRAALVHLAVSVGLGIAALALVFGLWYPEPLDEAVGVRGIVVLLLAVDVVIGPLLTLAVFDRRKRSLKFDLAVIAVLQAGAFVYGMHTIAEGRPAWLVFNADRFDVARANELDDRFERKPEFRDPPWLGPGWVASDNPADLAQRNALVLESAMGGADLAQRPDLYLPLRERRDEVIKNAQPLAMLSEFNSAEEVARARARWPSASGWLPLMSRTRPMVVLIDATSGDLVVSVVDLRPWRD
jgi:hypothetical protein